MVNFQLQDNVESKLISKWATFETFQVNHINLI